MRKHSTKTSPVFLTTDGEASSSLLPSSVSYPQGDNTGLGNPKKILQSTLRINLLPMR